MIRIAVMVSGQGRGSNMQAIIDACKSGKINGQVALVIGVKDDAPAMERARGEGAKTITLAPKNFDTPEGYDHAILNALTENRIDLICLAGYMRVLGQCVIDAYRNRIMNVHPALIPSFCGKGMYGHHVHEAVIARGVKFTGVTVHLVDEDYDTGPIILQSIVPVEEDDTPDTVAARVLKHEHQTYTDAVALFAEGRLRVVDRRVKIIES
ncbi:MAG: phosphoribosylglycinamide formyltransferase [Armatimonadota bacterium]|nr:phosphoribosylglycinamide formyltransferase [bacterium]